MADILAFKPNLEPKPDAWHVLVCGLPLVGNSIDLGESLTIRRLVQPMSVFDLASVGAAGFRQWAVLEPLAPMATSEIISPLAAAKLPGYDALNKCWLVSALLVIRGFAAHFCPAYSAYSWNLIAGHQQQTAASFRSQLEEEGVDKAIFEPRTALPKFGGGLLDYHLSMLVPRDRRDHPLDSGEGQWILTHFEKFNQLASSDERFRFALEASVDWRYAKDPRAAISRLWAGIESLFGLSAELVYRVSLFGSVGLAARGEARLQAYRRIKASYVVRSKAVHGEPLAEDKLVSGMNEAFDILRSLLLYCVLRGGVPTEDDLYRELLC
jgi:hypothetical protein